MSIEKYITMTTRRQSQTKTDKTDKAQLEKNKDDLEFIRAELVDLKKLVLKREDIKEIIRDVVKEILKDDEHIIANKIDEGIQVIPITGRVVICIWQWYLNHLCGIYNSH